MHLNLRYGDESLSIYLRPALALASYATEDSNAEKFVARCTVIAQILAVESNYPLPYAELSNMARLIPAVALLVASAWAQFVPSAQGLTAVTGYAGVQVRFKEVPTGICELDPSVKSYAGYADVDVNEHIHWWFFEARDVDPLAAPLTVWINGGWVSFIVATR